MGHGTDRLRVGGVSPPGLRAALAAGLVLAAVAVPVALAGTVGSDATTSGVKNKVKKIQKHLAALQQQVDSLAQQTGPPGPEGPRGPLGPRPETRAAT